MQTERKTYRGCRSVDLIIICRKLLSDHGDLSIINLEIWREFCILERIEWAVGTTVGECETWRSI